MRLPVVQIWLPYQNGYVTSHLFNHLTFRIAPIWRHCLKECLNLYWKDARGKRVKIGLRLPTSQTWYCCLKMIQVLNLIIKNKISSFTLFTFVAKFFLIIKFYYAEQIDKKKELELKTQRLTKILGNCSCSTSQ